MKRITLFILSLLFTIVVMAQIDSTEIKLQHYKDLFIKGLITAQDYEVLKQQTLGIKQQPTILTVVREKQEILKPTMDSIGLDKLKSSYRGNIGVGIAALAMGGGLFIADLIYVSSVASPKATGIISLAVAGSLAVTIGGVALGVGISQRNKYKKANGEAYLYLRSNGLAFAYNF